MLKLAVRLLTTRLSKVNVTNSSVAPHIVFLVVIHTMIQFNHTARSVTSLMFCMRIDCSPMSCWTQYPLHVLCTATQPLGGSGLLTHNFRIYYNFPALEGKNVVTNGSQSSQQTTREICLYEMKSFLCRNLMDFVRSTSAGDSLIDRF